MSVSRCREIRGQNEPKSAVRPPTVTLSSFPYFPFSPPVTVQWEVRFKNTTTFTYFSPLPGLLLRETPRHSFGWHPIRVLASTRPRKMGPPAHASVAEHIQNSILSQECLCEVGIVLNYVSLDSIAVYLGQSNSARTLLFMPRCRDPSASWRIWKPAPPAPRSSSS